MRRISHRSDSSVNRVHTYNMVDAKLDNPFRPERELRTIVREAKGLREYRPLRARLQSA